MTACEHFLMRAQCLRASHPCASYRWPCVTLNFTLYMSLHPSVYTKTLARDRR